MVNAENAVEQSRAIKFKEKVVNTSRLIEQTNLAENYPNFDLEILLSPQSNSVVGFVTRYSDRNALMRKLPNLRSEEILVSDFLESLEMPAPENWRATMRLALVSAKNWKQNLNAN